MYKARLNGILCIYYYIMMLCIRFKGREKREPESSRAPTRHSHTAAASASGQNRWMANANKTFT